MTILIVLFAICAFVYLAARVALRFSKKWDKELPDFPYNYVGGDWAVCSIADFKKAVERGSVIERPGKEPLVVVPETLVYSNNSGPMAQRFSGRLKNYPGEASEPRDWCAWKQNFIPKLFVPYLNERHIDFERQARIFIPPQDADEFKAQKRKENLKSDWRLRLTQWGTHDLLNNIKLISGGVGGLLLFVMLIFTNNLYSDSHKGDPATAYRVTNGVVWETHTTRGEM